MASVSLFRKWRSQKFADLVGQESVVQTLQNVLVGEAPARAYLFCGPRGTGKTSSARIFAKALNCENGPGLEPCNECGQCREISAGSSLDVFEIDAASHTQVDKIRDFIVDKVHFSPVSARVKVYIIDEVHKLSTSSFNALLKTLEEPPSHVVFILATTHPHELPPTILSRCQRYDFRPLTLAEIRNRLEYIAGVEGVSLSSEAADHLARAADGSLRDALVLFEQAVTFCGNEVEPEAVLELLGMVGYQVLEEMLMHLHRRDCSALLLQLHQLNAKGRDLKRLADAFLEHLRLVMLLKVKAPDDTFSQMPEEERQSLERLRDQLPLGALMNWIRAGMELAQEVREGRQARLLWELTMVRLANPQVEPSLAALQARVDELEQRVTAGVPAASAGSTAKTVSAPERPPSQPAQQKAQSETSPEPQHQQPHLEVRPEPSQQRPQPATRPEPQQQRPQPAARPEPQQQRPQPAARPEPQQQRPEPAARPEAQQQRPQPAARPEPRQQRPQPAARPEPQQQRPQRPVRPDPQAQKPPAEGRPQPTPRQPQRSQSQSQPLAQRENPPRKKGTNKKEFWRRLMQAVRDEDMRLHAVLADVRLLGIEDQVLQLGVPEGYDWHKEMVTKSVGLLERLGSGIWGAKLQMKCTVGAAKAPRSNEEEHEQLVKRASGLFAGDIVE